MGRLIAEHRFPDGQVVRLIHDDLTEEQVDAIVNAANAHLAHGGGVAGAIVRRGGDSIQSESDAWVRAHGLAAHDRPALTGAGRLPCRYVIHAVGPVWGSGDEEAKLATAVDASLRLASGQMLTSVALPAISTGIFGFPKALGARVILQATRDFLERSRGGSLREVHIAVIDEPTLQVFASEFERLWPDSQVKP